jgi:hypothetical protein
MPPGCRVRSRDGPQVLFGPHNQWAMERIERRFDPFGEGSMSMGRCSPATPQSTLRFRCGPSPCTPLSVLELLRTLRRVPTASADEEPPLPPPGRARGGTMKQFPRPTLGRPPRWAPSHAPATSQRSRRRSWLFASPPTPVLRPTSSMSPASLMGPPERRRAQEVPCRSPATSSNRCISSIFRTLPRRPSHACNASLRWADERRGWRPGRLTTCWLATEELTTRVLITGLRHSISDAHTRSPLPADSASITVLC